MKRLKKLGKNLLFWIPVIIFSWFFINYVETNYEKGIYKAPGKMVDVYGNKMHVYSVGKGNSTIVLLPGLGTTAPVVDYTPLTKELSKNNKVVVVEPFGYGYSEKTNRERTVDNIVDEIHMALKEVGVTENIVLMPHSASGIYAMAYANRYSNEVKAFIGIDCTLPRMCEYFNEKAPRIPSIMKYVAPSGLARLAVLLNAKEYLPDDTTHAYTKQEKKLMKAMTAWNGYNKDVVEEMNHLEVNMDNTKDLQFQADLPVLIFYAKDKVESKDHKSTANFYHTYIDSSDRNDLVELDGPHYLHWKYYKEIASTTNDFLNEASLNK